MRQREYLDKIFAAVLHEYSPRRVALLGGATSGGLASINAERTKRITAVGHPMSLPRTGSRLATLVAVLLDLGKHRGKVRRLVGIAVLSMHGG